MTRNPTDPATNVLYNVQAMAILEDAFAQLKSMGLHCGLGSDVMFPDSDMAAVLRVSTSEKSVDELIVASLVASDYTDSEAGRKRFDARFSEFLADCAIGKAMNLPGAPEEPVLAVQDGRWYWVRYECFGKTYEAPALYRQGAGAFYSIEFSGVPERQVRVLRAA